ncbi:MAG: DUF6266 family protein, partial [Ginsengibacter sp.]
ASIPNGILGKFTGTAGNVTGYMRYGKNFVRSRRRKSNKPMGPKRLAQQQKITVCNSFTSAFTGTGFFNVTFPSYGGGGSGYNRATSALMNQAVTGSYPGAALYWPKVLISKGLLPQAEHPGTAPHVDGTIFFSWTDNTGTGTAKADDKAVLVAYCPTLQQAVFSAAGAYRADCMATLTASIFKGHTVETWIGFVSNNERDAADSVYTGSIAL